MYETDNKNSELNHIPFNETPLNEDTCHLREEGLFVSGSSPVDVDLTEISGAIIVDKHEGLTSHSVVGKIRRLYGIKRVGHTGTLDPLATGVLPILIGRASISAEYLSGDDKRYSAQLKLGITTDTEDITGKILSECSSIPSLNEVIEVCHRFIGEISQTPPMYSALKVNGKKLVDLARKGIDIERKSRIITIYSLDVSYISDDTYQLDVHCSKGTYIRTLCADIGKILGCGGVMSVLRRTATGKFDISQSVTIAELENMTHEERMSKLIPVENLFSNYPSVTLPEFYSKLAHNGAEIYQKKINTAFDVGCMVKLYDNGGFFAVGIIDEFENGTAIRVSKLFVL